MTSDGNSIFIYQYLHGTSNNTMVLYWEKTYKVFKKKIVLCVNHTSVYKL